MRASLSLFTACLLGLSAAISGTLAPPASPASPPRTARPAFAHLSQSGVMVRASEAEDPEPLSLSAQRARLYIKMLEGLSLTAAQLADVRAIVEASPVLGQGNPSLSKHPISRDECSQIRTNAGLVRANEPVCGAPGMVPLFDPGSAPLGAGKRVCMDEFEFPDLPCEYPVVFARAREATLLCNAVGKRICDAHEWEGACAGEVKRPEEEYGWGRPREEHNEHHNVTRQILFSYGLEEDRSLCGLHSEKTPGCPGGGWDRCGSNTYPSGAFPACKSPFGVFDLHGNVAEHMNLPASASELAAGGGSGYTEMKGSWFVFGTTRAHPHPDDCRFRAPRWHETRLMSEASHFNYHLGFRCCKDAAGGDEQ